MEKHSPALRLASGVLRTLIVLNWIMGVLILTLLIASDVAGQWTLLALGFPHASTLRSMLPGLQAIAVLGLIAIPLNHAVLARLHAIVETVRAGDPFVEPNARRLQVIAWVMLALQLLSIAIGAVGKAISTPGHPLHLDAGFSTSGWLAVILTFVLARVFVEGTLMRRELEGTV